MIKKVLAFVITSAIVFAALPSQIVRAENGEVSYEEYVSEFADTKVILDNIEIPFNATITDGKAVSVNITVAEDGLYNFGMSYHAIGKQTSPIKIAIKVDGDYPFEEFGFLEFPRYWVDEEGEINLDGQGNEMPKSLVPYGGFETAYASDFSGWSNEPYSIYFSAGNHTVDIECLIGAFEVQSIVLGIREKTNDYILPKDNSEYYTGDTIIIEGENSDLKNSFWLTSKSDDTSANVTPCDPFHSKINYVGGNWKNMGETIRWKVFIKKAGYYKIGFSFRQETLIGSSSFRWLKIDGKTPFSEAKAIAFPFKSGWQKNVFENQNGEPYLFYLDSGEHTIEMTATLGSLSEVCELINEAVSILGDLYMDITMITGETVDIYRDYDLFVQISDMEDRLKNSFQLLKKSTSRLKNMSGQTSSSYTSVIDNMCQIIEKMLSSKYSAHRYKSNYYSNYCNLSSTLNEMRNMPLEIDQIYLLAPDKQISNQTGFLKNCSFSFLRFLASFMSDYNNVSSSETANDENSVEIWVNWGRDQAQVLNTLSQQFTEQTGIHVDIKVTNASMVQAVLSGKGPNVFLHSSRAEPVNLAIRNVLCNLKEFDDCDEILNRFQDGAEIPYMYKNGLYALPDTQTFYMMYYRKDIFEKLGLKVPKTWDEYVTVSKLLSRNNLDVWLPYTQITDMNQVNTGVGTLSLFPSLVMQAGSSLYSEDGKSTTLTSTDTIKVFTVWTDFYTKLKLPITLNFYNRFRIGTCPLGIDHYTLYNTLKAAAPEIDGKWVMTSIPGTLQEDGTIDYTSSGGGSGCGILKSNPQKELLAWEYLKWWTSADTQTAYSSNVESILGPTGRVAVSNVESLFDFSWDIDSRNAITKAWAKVKEVKEVPGSYYLSRAIDHSFWSVANKGSTPKDMMYKWGKEVDKEIARKWKQYENRN